jgi:hypothetical protein
MNIAPLLSGAGMKGKLLEPLNKGLPSLSSTKGLEGLHMHHLETVLQLDCKDSNYVQYAEQFVRYYRNTRLLDQIARNGKAHFEKWFSMDQGKLYCAQMFERLDRLTLRTIPPSRTTIAVIYQHRNATSTDIQHFLKFFAPFQYAYCFQFILVNNATSTQTDVQIAPDSVVHLKGSNRLYEFSAYQEGLDYLHTVQGLDNCRAFLICNETIYKHMPICLDQIVLETFERVCESRMSCGVLDNFGCSFQVGETTISHWLRSNCLFVNANVMRDLEYKLVSFSDVDSLPSLSSHAQTKIDTCLQHPRYANRTPDYFRMKQANILNEYMLTHRLQKLGNIVHLQDIKRYSYNFFDEHYPLDYDKVPCGDEWIGKEIFQLHALRIRSDSYVNTLLEFDFVFHCVPKCGETNVCEFLHTMFLQTYKEFEMLYPCRNNNFLNLLPGNVDRIPNLDKLKVVMSHMRATDFLEGSLLPFHVKKRIWIVREPCDRLIDHYYSFDFPNTKQHLMDLSEKAFATYCKQYSKFYCSMMGVTDSWNFIHMQSRIQSFFHILVYEHLDEDCRILVKKIKKRVYPVRNVPPVVLPTGHVQYVVKGLEEARSKVRQYLEDDCRLYKAIVYARKIG